LLAINEDLVLSLDCQPPCQVVALPKKLKTIIESPAHHESESEEVFDCDEWAPSARVFDPHPCPDPSNTENPVLIYMQMEYTISSTSWPCPISGAGQEIVLERVFADGML
jgi:hypothetical protein